MGPRAAEAELRYRAAQQPGSAVRSTPLRGERGRISVWEPGPRGVPSTLLPP